MTPSQGVNTHAAAPLCPDCGEPITRGPTGQRKRCPDCAAVHTKNRQREWQREYYSRPGNMARPRSKPKKKNTSSAPTSRPAAPRISGAPRSGNEPGSGGANTENAPRLSPENANTKTGPRSRPESGSGRGNTAGGPRSPPASASETGRYLRRTSNSRPPPSIRFPRFRR